MIRLVAFDTSSWWSGVALLEAAAPESRPEIIAEAGLLVRDSQSIHLLRLLDRLVAEAAWPRTSVDAYAATRGPGSFTGLRVGLGTIRGLALASTRPAIGVGTLVAMAEAFGAAQGDRSPLIDAGRGEVFGARFDPSASPPLERIAPWIGPAERALEGEGAAPVLFGSGARAHGDRLRSAGYDGSIPDAPRSVAAAAGRLALLRLAAGAPNGEGLSPAYLRPADAETKARK